ncbi:MAG: hypothetical protein ACXAC7_01185 [Candidatus Hodarchaeales archaeon]|jgi:hypothetical protein
MDTKNLASKLYKELENKINQLMSETGADFVTVSTVMNKLTKNFSSEISRRYP